MPQLFGRSANTIALVSIAVAGLLGGLVVALLYGLQASDYVTEVSISKNQPVPFSHEHHVAGLGLDCRYCHTSVEVSNTAGIPPVATCYNCHKHVWADAPMLKPIRDGYKNDTPLEWNRVHKLPDFVYFNHSAHVNHGVGCVSCHGKVNEMPLMRKANTLYMGWCLECHRNPGPNLRPAEFITDMDWKADEEWAKKNKLEFYGIKAKKPHTVDQLTNCWMCHR